MYRSIVAVYSTLSDAPELRRELEDSGVPPSQIHISTEDEPAASTTGLPAHEPRGFTDWLFGIPENDLSFFRESLEAGRTIVKVHVGEDLAEKVSQVLDRYGPITVESGREEAPETSSGVVVSVRSYIVELPFEDLVRQREEAARARRHVRAETGAAPERAREPASVGVGGPTGTSPRRLR
ncbi:MAG TPA: hypothetical protein VHM01_06560 [Alphaproteobacteria bacterium]|nr:hypothetical protein [Alphaproteobacteria bacterium]